MVIIFVLSHMPGPQSAETSKLVLLIMQFLHIDLTALFGDNATYIVRKTAHFTEYLILTCLLFHALRNREGRRRFLWAWGVAFLYACTDEFHQTFIPRRVGTPIDAMIDGAGAGLAILLIFLLRRRRSRRREKKRLKEMQPTDK